MAGTIELQYTQITDKLIEVKALCTADASAHTFPATVISPRPVNSDVDLVGWKLYGVLAVPGALGPTDDTDLTLTDLDGVDLLGARGTNLIDETAKTSCCAGTALTDMPMPVTGPITITISNNSVDSAVTTLKIMFIKD